MYRVIQKVKSRILPTVLNKTVATIVTADQALYGAVIGNANATAEVIFTLPIAAPGAVLNVIVSAAQNVKLKLATGDTIRGLATSGQFYTNNVVGSSLKLMCLVPTVWERVSAVNGTWVAS
jgi:hypothetical protein